MKMDTTVKYFNTSIDDATCNIAFRFRHVSKDLIVFLHGLGCSMKSFDMAFDAKMLDGFSILSLDFLGFGKSSRADHLSYSLESHAEGIEHLLAIYPDYRRHIVAHSMGGAIGLLLSENVLKSITTFINIEGNLIRDDCGLISRESSRVSFETFATNLYKKTRNPIWNTDYRLFSLESASPLAFYKSAKSLVSWSDSGKLLKKFQNLKCRKAYVYGAKNSNARVLKKLDGIQTLGISGSGHFAMNDNAPEFYEKIAQLIMKQEKG
ncbi:MAG: alpha/beta hydrolase [Proteobacteria bacterium]|nr:alpha/beta hydrolase [Pseudomonadota bacterium]